MNKAEKKHLRKLLAEFATDDLTSLAETVTQKRVSVTSTKDAINAIIQHSGSSEEFLNRRKVNRDILFHYSKKNNMKLSQNITKEEIVRKILDYWRQDVPKKSVQVGQVNQSTPSFAPESSNAASSSVALNVGQVQVGQEVVTKKSPPKKKKIAFDCAVPSATPTFTPTPSNTASSSVALNVDQVQFGQEVGTNEPKPKKKKTASDCVFPSATPSFTPEPSNMPSSSAAMNVVQVKVGKGVGAKKPKPKKKKTAYDCNVM